MLQARCCSCLHAEPSARPPRWAPSRPGWQDADRGGHLQGGSFPAPTQLIYCWSPSLDLGEALVPIFQHNVSEATQTSSIWNLLHTTPNISLTCPFLKGQRNQLSFYFQGAVAAGTKEKRGGNTCLKPFPKHLHLHAGWWTMSTHYTTPGADQGFRISEPVRSQTFSSEGAARVSFNQLPAYWSWATASGKTLILGLRNPTVHNSYGPNSLFECINLVR